MAGGLAVVLLLGLAGGVTFAVTAIAHQDPTPTPPASASTSSHTAAPAASVDPDPGQDRAACVAEVSAQESVAEALAASVKSWRKHTTAQLKLNAGEVTPQKANEMWAESQARGAADLRKYKKAVAGAEKVAGACEAIPDGDIARADLADCRERLDALEQANDRGEAAKDEWAHHQQMMAEGDWAEMAAQPGGGQAYLDMWRQMVQDSVPTLEEYDATVEELAAAPECA